MHVHQSNLGYESFYIKVHRSILKVQTHYLLYLFRKRLQSNLGWLYLYAMASVSVGQEVNVHTIKLVFPGLKVLDRHRSPGVAG